MKVSDLSGAVLDYWVARAEGHSVAAQVVEIRDKHGDWIAYHPSTNWAQGGPLIDGRGIFITCRAPGLVTASLCSSDSEPYPDVEAEGYTTLQAVCRVVVRAEFGDEVDDVEPSK